MNKFKKIGFYLFTILLIIIDQIVKLNIINNIENLPIEIINNILWFTYCENTGIAFSIGNGNVLIFIILNILLIIGLIFYYEKNKQDFNIVSKISISCVIAGGIGNLIDRIYRGFVVDFIDINKLFNFAIFNIADIYITIGILGLAIFYLKQCIQEK